MTIKNHLQLVSEIKLTYTRKVKADDRPRVKSSKDAYKLFRDNWNDIIGGP